MFYELRHDILTLKVKIPKLYGQHNYTMIVFTHFDFESVLSSNTHNLLGNIRYIYLHTYIHTYIHIYIHTYILPYILSSSFSRWVCMYPFFLYHLSSNRFSPLHDKHFKTDVKISCRIDELIIYPFF